MKILAFIVLAMAGLLSPAYGSGTIPFSLSQQLDKFGKPLSGCRFYVMQAGTVNTPQVAYQDAALTLPSPGGSQLTCDAAGRLPQFFLADGLIKVRLTDKNGVDQIVADGIQVIGPSGGGGGGGGSVDPTTVLSTGDTKCKYGTGVLTGFVRRNGRTIGSATSGATERANADAQSLFEYLWNADANLVVSTGRGASANADWVANKTIALPDQRGRVIAGLDDMGNTAAGRLTATYFGAAATTLGVPGGSESHTLTAAELAAHTHSGTTASMNRNQTHAHTQSQITVRLNFGASFDGMAFNGGGFATANSVDATNTDHEHTFTTNSGNGVIGSAHAIVQPTILETCYAKL